MKKLFLLTVISLLVFSFTNISCAQKEGFGNSDKAQDFTLEDINGVSVTLSQVIKENEATLLVFWTTWCQFCAKEIPDLIRLQTEYKDKGLKILAVNIGESKRKADLFVKQRGLNYTVLLDTNNIVATQYGVMGIPANILIGKDGSIKYRGTRPPDENLLPK